MSAGAIRAPLIIPLRMPVVGVPQSRIDGNTRLEIISDTPNVVIYYTVNGGKPTVGRTERELINSGTKKFKIPFILDPGLRTVKAIAVLPETGAQSNIVTKTFEVTKATGSAEHKQNTQGDFEFLEDLKAIEKHRPRSIKSHSEDRPSSNDSTRSMKRKSRNKPQPVNESNGKFTVSSKGDPRTVADKPLEPIQSLNRVNTVREFSAPITSYAEQSRGPTQLSNSPCVVNSTRCPHCMNACPNDPSQIFCAYCGEALKIAVNTDDACIQGTRIKGRLGQCPTCRSTVPLNLPNCTVCGRAFMIEQPLHAFMYQNGHHTQSGSSLPSSPLRTLRMDHYPLQTNDQTRSFCPGCGHANSARSRFCSFCGLADIGVQQLKPDSGGIENMDFRNCAFANNSHSYNPVTPTVPLQQAMFGYCTRCETLVPSESCFCPACGSVLLLMTNPSYSLTPQQFASNAPATSKPILHPQVANVTTQTVGLFYPSSAELRRRGSVPSADSAARDPTSRQSTPLLTSLSPGRGFWRKQLEHLTAHLKLYTTNNPEFRVDIGEPRFGKLLSAQLHKSHGKATIQLVYNLPDIRTDQPPPNEQRNRHRTSKNSKSAIQSMSSVELNNTDFMGFNSTESSELIEPEYYQSDEEPTETYGDMNRIDSADCNLSEARSVSSVMGDQMGSQSSFRDRPPSGKPASVKISKPSRTRPKRKSKHPTAALTPRQADAVGHDGEAGVAELRNSKLSAADKKLIHLLTNKAESTQEELTNILGRGADANCVDPGGYKPIVLAVKNNKAGAIPVLIKHGAKINTAGSPNGNTALHEAVSLGDEGVELTGILLRHGASLKATNKHRQTPYALALKVKSDPLTRIILSHMGETELKKLTEEAYHSTTNNNHGPQTDEF